MRQANYDVIKKNILEYAGEMGIDAAGVAPYGADGFRACIVCLFPYFAGGVSGGVSKYARGQDYHQVAGNILKKIAGRLQEMAPDALCLAGVDNHPLNERSLAVQAGLGVIGRNRCLIHPRYGSFVFIGTILTTLPLEPDHPRPGGCMECGRCVDACPGGALSDGRLALDRCLSHLSQKKRLAEQEEALLSRGIYQWGCDICQDVCPHNRDLPQTPFDAFRDDLITDLEGIEKENFKQNYQNRAFSWRGYGVIDRNRRIFREKSGKNKSESVCK